MSEFGSWLKSHREDAGLSQKEVAEKVGMHLQQVSQVERGVKGCPVKYLAPLAEFFESEISEVVNMSLRDAKKKLLQGTTKGLRQRAGKGANRHGRRSANKQ